MCDSSYGDSQVPTFWNAKRSARQSDAISNLRRSITKVNVLSPRRCGEVLIIPCLCQTHVTLHAFILDLIRRYIRPRIFRRLQCCLRIALLFINQKTGLQIYTRIEARFSLVDTSLERDRGWFSTRRYRSMVPRSYSISYRVPYLPTYLTYYDIY